MDYMEKRTAKVHLPQQQMSLFFSPALMLLSPHPREREEEGKQMGGTGPGILSTSASAF